ncbi:MxcI [Myxococcus sp. K15C18031901]|uniref:MxcI n=1 Tax=Myxococcus dinghuensis TaxID=2906761 RepID=UPI0020A78193|nr:MxcI [Myxococcus dinghuensis]MCP3097920.1 MxcI [Myxococcus dinghuensis]
MSSIARGLVAASAALVLASCGDDEPTPPGGGPDGNGEGELFMVHSAVETNGSRMNYFTLVDSLGEARTLDYAKSLELPGRPRLYAAQGVGFFAIGSGESPTITRYEVKDGALVAGASVSFQAQGVRSLGAQAVLFVSATKAYYKDTAQAQIIVWNPQEMVIEKTLPLPAELVKQGYVTGMSQWASRDGEAFFSVGWSSTTYDAVLPGTVLVRIDTATDALTWTQDDRCRDLTKTLRQGDTLYFFSGVINGLGYAVKGTHEAGQQDCFLRISSGKKAFDSDFVGTVSKALDDKHVGFVITVSEDGTAWLQVADKTITPTAPGTTYSEWYSKGWSWWKVPFASLTTAATRVQGDPGAYSSFTLTSGSNFFVSQSSSDYSTSTLMDLSTGAPKPTVSFPGFVLDVSRIR